VLKKQNLASVLGAIKGRKKHFREKADIAVFLKSHLALYFFYH